MVHRPTYNEVRNLTPVPRLAFLDQLPLPEADSSGLLRRFERPLHHAFRMPMLSGTAWFLSEVSLLGFFLYAQKGKAEVVGEPLENPTHRVGPEMKISIEATEYSSGHIRRCQSNLFEPFQVLIEDKDAHMYRWGMDQITSMSKAASAKNFSERFKRTVSLAVLGRRSPWISIVGQGAFVNAVSMDAPFDGIRKPVTKLALIPDLLSIELYPSPVMTEEERYQFLVGMLMNRSLFLDTGDVGVSVLWHGSSVHTQEESRTTACVAFAKAIYDHLPPSDFRTWFALAMGEWL